MNICATCGNPTSNNPAYCSERCRQIAINDTTFTQAVYDHASHIKCSGHCLEAPRQKWLERKRELGGVGVCDK